MTVALCRPKRQERLILHPIVVEIRGVQRTMLLDPARPSILATFRPWHGPALQIRATRSWTRNTSSSRINKSRSSNRNETNSSRSRTRNTRSWRNRMPVKGKSSKSNRSTSNRHSNWCKNTPSSNKNCRVSSSRARILQSHRRESLNSRFGRCREGCLIVRYGLGLALHSIQRRDPYQQLPPESRVTGH